MVALYEARGWRPVVAPELEFYLTALNPDPDLPLTPPAGRSGRAETSPQPYGLEAITEYEDLIEMIYEYAETAEVNVDTMIHESGTAQLEINFLHGDPVRLADQVLVFKRIVRQVALQHGVYATFMAKPMEHQPGSAMHLHVSVVSEGNGDNLFADAERRRQPDVPPLRRRPAALPARGDPAAGAQRELVPPHAPRPQRADQRAVGLRQPLVRPARADLGSAEPAGREPHPRGRRQSLPGDRRDADLRLPRHRSRRSSRRPRPAATPTTSRARCRGRSKTRWNASSAASRCATISARTSAAPSCGSRKRSWKPSRA